MFVITHSNGDTKTSLAIISFGHLTKNDPSQIRFIVPTNFALESFLQGQGQTASTPMRIQKDALKRLVLRYRLLNYNISSITHDNYPLLLVSFWLLILDRLDIFCLKHGARIIAELAMIQDHRISIHFG